jgi:hypothetical protein
VWKDIEQLLLRRERRTAIGATRLTKGKITLDVHDLPKVRHQIGGQQRRPLEEQLMPGAYLTAIRRRPLEQRFRFRRRFREWLLDINVRAALESRRRNTRVRFRRRNNVNHIGADITHERVDIRKGGNIKLHAQCMRKLWRTVRHGGEGSNCGEAANRQRMMASHLSSADDGDAKQLRHLENLC